MRSSLKFLFLGDVVGKPGYTAVRQAAAALKRELDLDALIVNAENAADGSGLTNRQFRRLIDAGVDGITMGDHIYRRAELLSILAQSDRIVRPVNYPAVSTGRRFMVLATPAGPLGVISVMGRTFMRPVDCPFGAVDGVLAEWQTLPPADRPWSILVDIHAEATSDKQSIARHLDGRVTAVLGTHTHVATADAGILPGGTALQCDVGMCGPHESIIGRNIGRVLQTTRTFEPTPFHVATGDIRLNGAIVTSAEDGRAMSIERFERRVGTLT